MTTDRYTNYDDDNIENQNFSEQYNDPFDERFLLEEKQLSDKDYIDSEYSNALDRNNEDDFDFEENTPESDLEDEDDDLDPDDMDDDLVERYDENDREPETFTDDGYKVD
ncbi:hypothetical protein K6T82_22910 [Flavobacterium sp. 17A]|uniref:Uncharacterized protein n=1 Tax=Flavobacterium potami TaxID=2872310 RepID=A0A9X1HEF4_9FLAO|nr:hypothetical protein [Flavobacterium potami]MBZ4037631.1 hypothetical protein [Flavobacterium potami]